LLTAASNAVSDIVIIIVPAKILPQRRKDNEIKGVIPEIIFKGLIITGISLPLIFKLTVYFFKYDNF
jgi:hypothetical protein